ncbi:MAG: putative circularly permuted ATP-grasp superfamily protein, partial [Candidatus Azotimanducaceae bacterium]
MDLKNYTPPAGAYDEILTEKNRARPELSQLVNFLKKNNYKELAARSSAAELLIRTMGITFTVYSEG